jgi:hypothetical protein
VEGLGHLRGREGLLLDLVEAAGVDHPEVADVPLLGVGGPLEVAVEPVEEHRIADPHDPCDQVDPAGGQMHELAEVLEHGRRDDTERRLERRRHARGGFVQPCPVLFVLFALKDL